MGNQNDGSAAAENSRCLAPSATSGDSLAVHQYRQIAENVAVTAEDDRVREFSDHGAPVRLKATAPSFLPNIACARRCTELAFAASTPSQPISSPSSSRAETRAKKHVTLTARLHWVVHPVPNREAEVVDVSAVPVDRMSIPENTHLTQFSRVRLVRSIESGQTPNAAALAAGVCPRTTHKS